MANTLAGQQMLAGTIDSAIEWAIGVLGIDVGGPPGSGETEPDH